MKNARARAARPRNARPRTRTRRMGEELVDAMEEAAAHARGECDLKVTWRDVDASAVHPAPEYSAQEIAEIRKNLDLSQPVFAAALNVSSDAVKKWEQNVRRPEGAVLRLLEITRAHPDILLEKIGRARRTGVGRTV